MRSVTRMRLAMVGLALAVPASTRAGQPEVCIPCQDGQAVSHIHVPRLCNDCLAKQQARGGAPTMIGGDLCATCQAMPGGMPPGFATVGGPAPGHASTGGGMPMAEPAPIGVVQASFTPPGTPAAMAPGRAMAGPMAQPLPMASMNEHPDLFAPQPRHRSFLASLLGLPRLDARREMKQAEARKAHAAISYDPGGQRPIDLPSTMVHGR